MTRVSQPSGGSPGSGTTMGSPRCCSRTVRCAEKIASCNSIRAELALVAEIADVSGAGPIAAVPVGIGNRKLAENVALGAFHL